MNNILKTSKEILNYVPREYSNMAHKTVHKKARVKTPLEEAIEESMKLSHEEHLERCRRAIEGSLRRSGVLKGKRRFL